MSFSQRRSALRHSCNASTPCPHVTDSPPPRTYLNHHILVTSLAHLRIATGSKGREGGSCLSCNSRGRIMSWTCKAGVTHGIANLKIEREQLIVSYPSDDQMKHAGLSISRRAVGSLLSGACLSWSDFAAAAPSKALQHAPPHSLCEEALSGPLAAAFTRSIYTAVLQQQKITEEEFQREAFLLRSREFKYYREANRGRLPSLPDLSDDSGGLSNAVYFNFVQYIALKVVARHVTSPADRTAFCLAAGSDLLDRIWPEGRSAAAQVAAEGRATEVQLLSLLQSLLERLLAGHYICGYQITWGETPGGWPADWMTQERTQGLPARPVPIGPEGLVFQVKLHKPADIAGCVALRSEESGFWARSVSSMARQLFAAAGHAQSTPNEYFFQDEWKGPATWQDNLLLLFGDPLEAVGIPFDPTTLVQDWQLAPSSGGASSSAALLSSEQGE